MTPQESDAPWALVEAELDHWRAAGRIPGLFLRDDDAVSHTPALDRLAGLCAKYNVALLLACIPANSDTSLGRFVRANPMIRGAAHGYAHASHAPMGQKPCELGTHRPLEHVLAELARGRNRLLDLFDGELSGLLAPPWNRIDDPVAAKIGVAGFSGISAYGWQVPGIGTPYVNTHIDIIHWSGGRKGRSLAWLFGEIARNLAAARGAGWGATGILSHHLVHDDAAWEGLESIFSLFGRNRGNWVTADSLLGELARPAAISQA